MSLHGDLLQQARLLATHEPRRPRQSSLRRAGSASYYALFHLMVHEAVSLLVVGADRKSLRNSLSRAFVHAQMKEVAQQFAGPKGPSPKVLPALKGQALPSELKSVASAFVDVQQARHEADYDVSRDFTREECMDLVSRVQIAFSDWRKVRKTLSADVFLVALLAQKQMQA